MPDLRQGLSDEASAAFARLKEQNARDIDSEDWGKVASVPDTTPASANQSDIVEYKKGGRVRRTGPAKVHKGEYVVNAKATKKNLSKLRAMNGRSGAFRAKAT